MCFSIISSFLFRTDRFIDPSTGKVKNDERLVPFGAGTRLCIGITLAQNELYLFLSAFLQQFQFSDPTPDVLEPKSGFVLECPDFRMTIREREEISV
jgi:cytochrome P450